MDIYSIIRDFHAKKFIIILTIMSLLILTAAGFHLAAATPFTAGYSHGCDDGKLGYHKYLNTPGKGIDNHTPEFMQEYDNGYKACFSPNGSGSDGSSSSIKSQSKSSSNSVTGGTFVSCNRLEHTAEYCNGYRAGAVQSDVNDDPDENITPSKVTCEGGVPSSEYCQGYQQGYSDEDHAMFSPH
jgi:hypothetical protein